MCPEQKPNWFRCRKSSNCFLHIICSEGALHSIHRGSVGISLGGLKRDYLDLLLRCPLKRGSSATQGSSIPCCSPPSCPKSWHPPPCAYSVRCALSDVSLDLMKCCIFHCRLQISVYKTEAGKSISCSCF